MNRHTGVTGRRPADDDCRLPNGLSVAGTGASPIRDGHPRRLEATVVATRQRLDERLSTLKPEDRFSPPPKGWIRAIRDALGMTGVQLAARMRVRPQTLEALEKSEASGSIQLSTLRRAAEALDRIGIEAYRIGTEVAQLMDDVRYWVANNTYAADEIAVRFHHQLVAIHPFPNGNGRHSRLMADLLIERPGGAFFSWGGGSLTDTGELRRRYVAALRAADNHDIGPLLAFARS